jgi:subtilisin family serine protease
VLDSAACDVPGRIRIAVIDNGVETTHEDLAANMTAGWDYTSDTPGDDPNPEPSDAQPRHGTQAAGVIAACGNNDQGVSGICPLCEILPIRIDPIEAENALPVFYDLINLPELWADVVSASWGGQTTDELTAALNIISGTNPQAPGIPAFFAVQNQNEDWCGCGPNEQCDTSGIEGVIGVSASSNGDVAGLIGGFGSCIDLVAPTQKAQSAAGNVITTDLTTALTYTTDSNGFGGTSSATALTAGIAGLVLSLNPELTQKDVRNILQHTAEKIATVGGGYDSNGFSPRAGYGRVNAHRAVVPVVKITASANLVQVNEPFDVTVSASAPHLLSSIGWSMKHQACSLALDEWRTVDGKAFHEETWSGLKLTTPGQYTFIPNAKDMLFPLVDEYPHIASDAFSDLPEVVVTVQGTGPGLFGCTTPNPPTNLRSQ